MKGKSKIHCTLLFFLVLTTRFRALAFIHLAAWWGEGGEGGEGGADSTLRPAACIHVRENNISL